MRDVLNEGFGCDMPFEKLNVRLPETADAIKRWDASGKAESWEQIKARLGDFYCDVARKVAFSGGVLCQQQRFFDISMGTGTMVIGLANVIIGTQLLKRFCFIRSTTAVIIGSIVYKACVSIALLLNDLHIGGLDISIPVTASDLKLITSVLFLIILVVSPSGGKKVKSHA